MNVSFSPEAWEEYLEWQRTDKAIIKRINMLIKDTVRSPFSGIGKPEPLKHLLAGSWSRRIDEEHRLVYRLTGETLIITSCKHHYGD